ncbi:MAG: hypothetical protein P4L31_07110, partial [Candidatus Babeliales bacterium]|nr:hypothetical protein [Candidatus Babeliales bacterium]
MKYKNIIFFAVLLINGFSSYAMNPSDYKLDGYGCTRCFGRTIHTLCHIALAACCKIYNEDITDPNGRVFLAAYNNDSDELAAALINGGNIDAGDLVSLAYY